MQTFQIKSLAIISVEVTHRVQAETENAAIQKIDTDCQKPSAYIRTSIMDQLLKNGVLEVHVQDIQPE